jgi:hypothetical protein
MLLLASLALSACTIEEGSFDGSFFDEDGAIDEDDGGRPNDDEDSGSDAKDAGKPDSGTDSGKDAGSDSGQPAQPTASDVPGFIARGRCGALEACIGKQLLAATFEGNDCVEYTTRQLADRDLHWLQKSIDAKRVTFRPEKLAQCERDIRELDCSVTTRPLPFSCEDAIEGQFTKNQDCWIDQDCNGAGFCDKGQLETCPGTCVEPQIAGMLCTASAQCASGLVCRDGMCDQPLTEGDSCTSRLTGSECPPGLICQGATTQTLTCQSVQTLYSARLDQECDAVGKLCEFGLVCQSQSSENTIGKCVAAAAKGGTCRRAQPSQCPADQFCKAMSGSGRVAPGVDGVCSDLPSSGQSCGVDGCVPGLRCLGETGETTCRPIKSAGGSCELNGECYGGLCTEDICSITTIECG